jgi:hypothetical protein
VFTEYLLKLKVHCSKLMHFLFLIEESPIIVFSSCYLCTLTCNNNFTSFSINYSFVVVFFIYIFHVDNENEGKMLLLLPCCMKHK